MYEESAGSLFDLPHHALSQPVRLRDAWRRIGATPTHRAGSANQFVGIVAVERLNAALVPGPLVKRLNGVRVRLGGLRVTVEPFSCAIV